MLNFIVYFTKALSAVLVCVLFSAGVHSSPSSKPDALPAPHFSLPAIANTEEAISLDAFKGYVTYVDFWASWCGPCLVAMPKIETLRQTIDSDEFVVLAVNVDRNLKKARKFLTKIGVGYDSLVDEQGRVSASYGLNAMPSSFVINRAGVVTKVHEGFRDGDEDELRAHIKAVIDSGA